MTSKIKIYQTEIIPDRNVLVESLDKYLEGLTPKYQEDNFQYQQISGNLSITIAADQSLVGKSVGNYLTLEQDNRIYYYFILGAEWLALKTVRLNLALDTVNTYAKDLEFTSQTTIEREQQDRFIDTKLKIGTKKLLKRKIDKFPEGIPSTAEITEHTKIKDKLLPDLDWYLIYETKTDLTKDSINPVNCKLLASEELLVTEGHTNLPKQRITAKDLENGKYYYFDPVSNPNGKFESSKSPTGPTTLTDTEILVFYKDGNKVMLYLLKYKKNGNFYDYIKPAQSETEIFSGNDWIDFIDSTLVREANQLIRGYSDITSLVNYKPIIAGTVKEVKTIKYDDLDKTNSRLMKIIKLPYCPINITKTGNNYNIPANWQVVNGMIVLQDKSLSTKFEREINSLNLKSILEVQADPNPTDLIVPENESKLLNSEFTTLKVNYDSFSKDIRLEDLNDTETIKLKFKPTNTINSKFAFKLDFPQGTYDQHEDYENFLLVSRNNEETIFSNDYLNYIRNGINYDKKARNMAFGNSITNSILGIGGAAATQYFGTEKPLRRERAEVNFLRFATKNHHKLPDRLTDKDYINSRINKLTEHSSSANALTTVAGISMASQALNGVINAAFTYQSATDAINRKKQELAVQATNVSGSDDIDLLSYYNGNRLDTFKYEPRQDNKDLISKVFHYSGYSHPKQELPNINSRYWFNYIKCSPVFKNENSSVYTEYLDDIKARFETGITVLHYRPEIKESWDFYQEHENWESNLIDTSYYPKTKLANLQISGYVFSQDTLIGQFNYQDFDDRVNGAEIKFINTFGEELIVPYESIDTVDGTISFEARDIDLTKPIYVRETALYNSELNSDWMLWKEYN